MKKSIPSFLAGVLVATIFFSLSVTAMAATGLMKIEVAPINVKIFGQTSKTFAYNGVTYAPLRQVAEACGLEVGYDSVKNMATIEKQNISAKAEVPVNNTNTNTNANSVEQELKDFASLWTLQAQEFYEGHRLIDYIYDGNMSKKELGEYVRSLDKDTILAFCNDEYPKYTERDKENGQFFFYYKTSDEYGNNLLMDVDVAQSNAWRVNFGVRYFDSIK